MLKNKKNTRLLFIHFIAYILLLIATPFFLLKNYMQSAIGQLSEFNFVLFDVNIPYILLLFILLITAFLIVYRKYLSGFRIISIIIIFVLIFIGHNSTDFYFNHKFYELQHNWHYFAYSIFVFFSYRWMKEIGIKTSKIILYTFVAAMVISTVDEAVQIPLSNRIFDACDIAKDLWGSIIGMVFIFFVIEEGKEFRGNWRINYPKLKGYLNSPFASFINLAIFSEILLLVTSLLSNINFLKPAIFISLLIFLIVFLIIYLLQYKISRIIVISVITLLLITLSFKYFNHDNKKIVQYKSGLIIYKGIPIPYFDIMIYNNGSFRLVDKKTSFNARDKRTIFNYAEDILIIGNTDKKNKIRGFNSDSKTQFAFNYKKGKALQVILQDIRNANKKYNELKTQGYNVVYIIHQK